MTTRQLFIGKNCVVNIKWSDNYICNKKKIVKNSPKCELSDCNCAIPLHFNEHIDNPAVCDNFVLKFGVFVCY